MLQLQIYDIIGIGAWQTVYAMLHQLFNDITTEILSTVTSACLKQMIILKSFNSVLYEVTFGEGNSLEPDICIYTVAMKYNSEQLNLSTWSLTLRAILSILYLYLTTLDISVLSIPFESYCSIYRTPVYCFLYSQNALLSFYWAVIHLITGA